MLLKLRKPTLQYTFIKNHVHKLCLRKHVNLPISKMPVNVMQIVYIYMTAITPNYALHMMSVLIPHKILIRSK